MITQSRKYQVFVSSTYLDLKLERQAAVEAILESGNIPAGMELFAANDESQMDVIRRWIEDSDIFMLILGARYGTIEPKSGKSYIHLEYEHAISKGKPLFAVVMSESYEKKRVAEDGKSVLELDNPEKLKGFKDVVTAKMSSFFDDKKDIKLAVHKSLPQLVQDRQPSGWVRATEVTDAKPVIEELSALRKAYEELKTSQQSASRGLSFNGYTFEMAREELEAMTIPAFTIPGERHEYPEGSANLALVRIREWLETGIIDAQWRWYFDRLHRPLIRLGIVEVQDINGRRVPRLTNLGHTYVNLLNTTP